MRCHRTILGIRYVTNDAVQNTIRQEKSLLGNLVTTVENRKLKYYSTIIRANTFHYHRTMYHFRQMKRRKIWSWQHHWMDRKITQSDSEISMEGAGQVLICVATLWPHPVMGLWWETNSLLSLLNSGMIKLVSV